MAFILFFQSRIEILGVLDRATGRVRLRCADPNKYASPTDKFASLMRAIPVWVQKNSKIIVDGSLDKERLFTMGYSNIVNSQNNRRNSEGSNGQVMGYLVKAVSKVFSVRKTR